MDNSNEVYIIDEEPVKFSWMALKPLERRYELTPILKSNKDLDDKTIFKTIHNLNELYERLNKVYTEYKSINNDIQLNTDCPEVQNKYKYDFETIKTVINKENVTVIVRDNLDSFDDDPKMINKFIDKYNKLGFGNYEDMVNYLKPYSTSEESEGNLLIKMSRSTDVIRHPALETRKINKYEKVEVIGFNVNGVSFLFGEGKKGDLEAKNMQIQETLKKTIEMYMSFTPKHVIFTPKYKIRPLNVFTKFKPEKSGMVDLLVEELKDIYNIAPIINKGTYQQIDLFAGNERDNGELYKLIKVLLHESKIGVEVSPSMTELKMRINELSELYQRKCDFVKDCDAVVSCESKGNICVPRKELLEKETNTLKKLLTIYESKKKNHERIGKIKEEYLKMARQHQKEEELKDNYRNYIIKIYGKKRYDELEQESIKQQKNIMQVLNKTEEETIKKYIKQTSEYRTRYTCNSCPHFELKRKFHESFDENYLSGEMYDHLKKLINIYGTEKSDPINKWITCNNCGFYLCCEHYRLLLKHHENPDAGYDKELETKYYSTNRHEYETSGVQVITCKYCGYMIKENKQYSSLVFDKVTKKVQTGIFVQSKSFISLRDKLNQILFYTGLSTLNGMNVAREVYSMIKDETAKLNALKVSKRELPIYREAIKHAIIYAYLIYRIIDSNSKINYRSDIKLKQETKNKFKELFLKTIKIIKRHDPDLFLVVGNEKVDFYKYVKIYYEKIRKVRSVQDENLKNKKYMERTGFHTIYKNRNSYENIINMKLNYDPASLLAQYRDMLLLYRVVEKEEKRTRVSSDTKKKIKNLLDNTDLKISKEMRAIQQKIKNDEEYTVKNPRKIRIESYFLVFATMLKLALTGYVKKSTYYTNEDYISKLNETLSIQQKLSNRLIDRPVVQIHQNKLDYNWKTEEFERHHINISEIGAAQANEEEIKEFYSKRCEDETPHQIFHGVCTNCGETYESIYEPNEKRMKRLMKKHGNQSSCDRIVYLDIVEKEKKVYTIDGIKKSQYSISEKQNTKLVEAVALKIYKFEPKVPSEYIFNYKEEFSKKLINFGILKKRKEEEISAVSSTSGIELLKLYNELSTSKIREIIKKKYATLRMDTIKNTIYKLHEHISMIVNNDSFINVRSDRLSYLEKYIGNNKFFKILDSFVDIENYILKNETMDNESKGNILYNILIQSINAIVRNKTSAEFILEFFNNEFKIEEIIDTTDLEKRKEEEHHEYLIDEKKYQFMIITMDEKKLHGMAFKTFREQEEFMINVLKQKELIEGETYTINEELDELGSDLYEEGVEEGFDLTGNETDGIEEWNRDD